MVVSLVNNLMISKLKIKSDIHKYEVFFEKKINIIFKNFSKDTIFIVDRNVYNLFLKNILKNKIFLLIDSNEKNKDFYNLKKYINFFIKNVSKKTKVVAIGGGVTQDVVSFVCSIYKRGIDWDFIPTTIISQSDSCIGGKTSINYNGVKNTLGNFYPPKKIILCPDFISKLPKKEFYSGLGEMAHYYFLSNKKDYFFYKNNLKKINNKIDIDIYKLILKSLKIKKKYIEKDEFDKNHRLKLNYGHTFGHALENLLNIPHGIAVAHGMNISNFISASYKFISQEKYYEMRDTLNYITKDYNIGKINLDKFLKLLKKDKKSTIKNIRVILTKDIGKMFVYTVVNEGRLKNTLTKYFNPIII